MNTHPLTDLTVLDLTRVRSGPTAAKFLADWGADVIRIEPPASLGASSSLVGDRDSADFQNLHRNKRSVTLNLKTPDGQAIFHRFAAKADIVIENFRPGVLDRLGVDYDALKETNPAIILASLSGYGQTGPYAKRPAYDQIIQGLGGFMSVTGLSGQGPVRAGIPIADLSTGLFAMIGILVAVIERQTSGKGQWVQTSLYESQIGMMDLQAARYLGDGVIAQTAGNHHPTGIPTGMFATADGHINISVDGEDMWHRLCGAIGCSDLVDEPAYVTMQLRSDNREALNAAIGDAFALKSTSEWMDILIAADVPCGPVHNMGQVFNDPQTEALDLLHPVEHPRLGKMNLLAQPVNMSRSTRRTGVAAPDAGEHTDEVFANAGYSDEDISAFRSAGII